MARHRTLVLMTIVLALVSAFTGPCTWARTVYRITLTPQTEPDMDWQDTPNVTPYYRTSEKPANSETETDKCEYSGETEVLDSNGNTLYWESTKTHWHKVQVGTTIVGYTETKTAFTIQSDLGSRDEYKEEDGKTLEDEAAEKLGSPVPTTDPVIVIVVDFDVTGQELLDGSEAADRALNEALSNTAATLVTQGMSPELQLALDSQATVLQSAAELRVEARDRTVAVVDTVGRGLEAAGFAQELSQLMARSNDHQDQEELVLNSPAVGDPVLIATGQFQDRDVDWTIPGPSGPLEISRIHRSDWTGSGYFGSRWHSILDARVFLSRWPRAQEQLEKQREIRRQAQEAYGAQLAQFQAHLEEVVAQQAVVAHQRSDAQDQLEATLADMETKGSQGLSWIAAYDQGVSRAAELNHRQTALHKQLSDLDDNKGALDQVIQDLEKLETSLEEADIALTTAQDALIARQLFNQNKSRAQDLVNRWEDRVADLKTSISTLTGEKSQLLTQLSPGYQTLRGSIEADQTQVADLLHQCQEQSDHLAESLVQLTGYDPRIRAQRTAMTSAATLAFRSPSALGSMDGTRKELLATVDSLDLSAAHLSATAAQLTAYLDPEAEGSENPLAQLRHLYQESLHQERDQARYAQWDALAASFNGPQAPPDLDGSPGTIIVLDCSGQKIHFPPMAPSELDQVLDGGFSSLDQNILLEAQDYSFYVKSHGFRLDHGLSMAHHRSLHFNGAGQLTRSVPGRGQLAWNLQYFESGVLKSLSTENGAVLELEMDNGLVRSMAQGPEAGQLSRSYDYDSQGQLVFVSSPSDGDSKGDHGVRYWYEGGAMVQTELPSGQRYQYRYNAMADGQSRAVANRNHDGSEAPTLWSETFAYDLAPWESGSRVAQVRFAPDHGPATVYHLDQRGRTVYEAQEGTGQWSSFSYDSAGRLVQRSNHLEEQVCWTYDDGGRPLSKTTQLGTSPPVTETWTYDPQGRVLSHGDLRGCQWVYHYDQGPDSTPGAKPSLVEGWSHGQLIYRLEQSYDSHGRLTRSVQGSSDGPSISWDFNYYPMDQGGLLRSRSRAGETSSFTYDSFGRLATTTNPWGKVTHYSYDGQGRLVSIGDDQGPLDVYGYGPQGLLWQEGPRGQRTEYGYDGRGNINRISFPDGSVQAYEYDWGPQPVTTLWYNSVEEEQAGRPYLRRSVREEYSPGGERSVVTRSSTVLHQLTSSQVFDSLGRLKVQTGTDGLDTRYHYHQGSPSRLEQVQRISSSQAQSRTTEFIYGGSHQLPQEPSGFIGPTGGQSRSTVDSLGRTVSQERSDGQGTWLGREYHYTLSGQIARVQDEAGRVTSYSYDSNGRLVGESFPNSSELRYEHSYQGTLRVETIDHGTDVRSSYNYNSQAQLIRSSQWDLGDAGAPVRITEYSYDRRGRMRSKQIMVDSQPSLTTQWTYDSMGRLSQVVHPSGAVETLAYNPLGQLLSRTIDDAQWTYRWSPLGLLLSQTDPDGYTTSYGYDPQGQLQSITGPDGVQTQIRRDPFGEVRGTQYSDGSWTVTGPSLLASGSGELPSPDQLSSTNLPSYRTHRDPLGRSTGATNRLGQIEGRSYDPHTGLLQLIDHFDGAQTSFSYNSQASLSSMTITGPQGNTEGLAYSRDRAGRTTSVTNDQGTVSFEYNGFGQVSRSTDVHGLSCAFHYDSAGRLARKTIESTGETWIYTYDQAGNLSQILIPQGAWHRFTYDSQGRLLTRIDSDGSRLECSYSPAGRVLSEVLTGPAHQTLWAVAYGYDDAGRRSWAAYGDGSRRVFHYDPKGQLTQVRYSNFRPKALADFAYFKEAGIVAPSVPEQQMAQVMAPSPLTQRLTPDPAMTLAMDRALADLGILRRGPSAGSIGAYVESFTYDPQGNRSSWTTPFGTIEYRYDAENRLITAGAIEYQHDHGGRLTQARGALTHRSYGYNLTGRQTSVKVQAVQHSPASPPAVIELIHSYDGLGRRISTTTQGPDRLPTITTWNYATLDFIPLAATEAPQATASLQRGTGTQSPSRYRPLHSPPTSTNGRTCYTTLDRRTLSTVKNGTTAYLHSDTQDSLVYHSQPSGPGQAHSYDPFGHPLQATGPQLPAYNGKYYDPHSQSYNYGHRDYSPHRSRFTTPDPILDGPNWYRYANNDPINQLDRWGLEASEGGGGSPGILGSPITTLVPTTLDPNNWNTSGAFGEDYSNVPGASVDSHLGIDEIWTNSSGSNGTIGRRVLAPEDLIVTDVGSNAVLGNFLRGETMDGARIDIFHEHDILVDVGQRVPRGAVVAIGGETGVGNAHVHTAKSYPMGMAPGNSVNVIQEFGRDYIEPPTQQDVLDLVNQQKPGNIGFTR